MYYLPQTQEVKHKISLVLLELPVEEFFNVRAAYQFSSETIMTSRAWNLTKNSAYEFNRLRKICHWLQSGTKKIAKFSRHALIISSRSRNGFKEWGENDRT